MTVLSIDSHTFWWCMEVKDRNGRPAARLNCIEKLQSVPWSPFATAVTRHAISCLVYNLLVVVCGHHGSLQCQCSVSIQ